jgi:hypothetical protein
MPSRVRGTIGLLMIMLAWSGPVAAQSPSPQPPKNNLQVLPKGLAWGELIETMERFSRALGVHCEHCHHFTCESALNRSINGPFWIRSWGGIQIHTSNGADCVMRSDFKLKSWCGPVGCLGGGGSPRRGTRTRHLRRR